MVYSFQFHITAKCDQNCLHCYIKEKDSYLKELKNELSLEQVKKIVDSMIVFTRHLSALRNTEVVPKIVFSGGDPLLRKDFFSILEYVKEKKITNIGILGNSYHINKESVSRMRELGVTNYQISVDGLEKNHDKIRKEGSFKDAFRAFEVLKNGGIKENVMMTLMSFNYKDLFPLIEYCQEKEIDRLAFARVSAVGNARDFALKISPFEYRDLLIKFTQLEERNRLGDLLPKLTMKEHLLELVLYEMGKISKDDIAKSGTRGCHMLRDGMTVLSDGRVVACRRFYDEIGDLKQEDVFTVYHKKSAQKYFNHANYIKCRNCFLVNVCRGCPAVAMSTYGSPFSPDPQCWAAVSF